MRLQPTASAHTTAEEDAHTTAEEECTTTPDHSAE
jgi:hypothetical protein